MSREGATTTLTCYTDLIGLRKAPPVHRNFLSSNSKLTRKVLMTHRTFPRRKHKGEEGTVCGTPSHLPRNNRVVKEGAIVIWHLPYSVDLKKEGTTI